MMGLRDNYLATMRAGSKAQQPVVARCTPIPVQHATNTHSGATDRATTAQPLADLHREESATRDATTTQRTPATDATNGNALRCTLHPPSEPIRQHKAELIAELGRPSHPDLFVFTSPTDPESDREAIEERAGIMAEANNWTHAVALQEARWQADKERCWRRFLQHAALILGAPIASRAALLDEYRRCATAAYGVTTADRMCASMWEWISVRKDETCH